MITRNLSKGNFTWIAMICVVFELFWQNPIPTIDSCMKWLINSAHWRTKGTIYKAFEQRLDPQEAISHEVKKTKNAWFFNDFSTFWRVDFFMIFSDFSFPPGISLVHEDRSRKNTCLRAQTDLREPSQRRNIIPVRVGHLPNVCGAFRNRQSDD